MVLGITNDGPLPTQWNWTGLGKVDWSHDADFRVRTEHVNDLFGIAYDYDDDGLPTRVGEYVTAEGSIVPAGIGLTLTWDTLRPVLGKTVLQDAGALTRSTEIVHVTNPYGELTSSTASAKNGAATTLLYAVTYEDAEAPRDAKGRVVRKIESIAHTGPTAAQDTIEHRYQYDAQGRLWKVFIGEASVAPAYTYAYDDNGNRPRRAAERRALVHLVRNLEHEKQAAVNRARLMRWQR